MGQKTGCASSLGRRIQRFLAVGLIALSGTAMATDAYPSKPIRLLVGFGAGGPTDITFRKLAELAGRELGQNIIVENKPGAGATLAPAAMARQDKPDGYTIAAATSGLLRMPHMQKVDWDPMRDFTWISGLGGYSFVLAVKSTAPYRTVGELVADAKANPGKVSIATAGAGTTMHLLTEAFGSMAGIDVTHVGFKSSAEATTNLMGGHTVASLDAIGSVLPFVKSGDVRLLMSFDAAPAKSMPDLPTASSLGYDLVYPAPYGLVGPKGMPPEVVAKLAAAFKAAIDSPEYAKLLQAQGQTYWYKGPADYATWAQAFYQSERSLVERAKLLKP
ncbi:MAG: tripartite tricarboxylate transporter substrate binding protein [Rhodoferax sp.]|nr:tripartite tricarboxylate transporter substrate binding protein [Rhodoferax sp.]MCB2004883.1 tripartite tricarboxylate transporter substrate binding protein [Rhodoferax sp.]MCB2029493.1 tripartite tricarboxylate transporter substrate binding protein [Rhodoferax sp.]MCB2044188.1 tripartite tricarboxylate transporter substrate binding protein [Rhodoferax sp.]MCP5262376.1 tripartite tricarboxylate transporter substrate binding protein [Rhodoferax sp.]